MSSKVISYGELGKKLIVEVSSDVVEETFLTTYKRLQNKANLKGFRKGKVPLDQVKKIYGNEARREVLTELVNRFYLEALKEHQMDPVTHPQVEVKSFESGGELVFEADFEVRPEIKIKKIENLKIYRPDATIKEADVDKVIEQIQVSQAKTYPLMEMRGVQKGDVVDIDFEGFIDGAPLPGGKGQNHQLEIGSNSFIPGFEDGLLGAKHGEKKEIQLSFPKGYFKKDLQEKKATFQVTVNKILTKKIPEWTDEFVSSLGTPSKTVEEFRNKVRDNIQRENEQKSYEGLREDVLKEFVKQNGLTVPPKLKEKQKNHLIKSSEEQLKKQSATPEEIKKYRKKWEAEFDELSERMVSLSLLIGKLSSEQKELSVERREVENKILADCESLGLSKARAEEIIQSDKFEEVRYSMVEKKVADHLISKAQIKVISQEKYDKLKK